MYTEDSTYPTGAEPTAMRIYKKYRRYLENTQEWREERDRLEHIYHGYVFETGEGADYEADNVTTVVDNRLRPLIRKRVSKLVANKPTGKVFGVSDEDQSMVDTFSAMADYFWEISDGGKAITNAVTEQQKLGAGYLLLYHDPDDDYGLGELKFDSLSYRDVYYDKQAKRIEDAPCVIVRKLMDADQFFEENPDIKNEDKPSYLHPDDTIRYSMEGTDGKMIDTGLPETFEGGEKEFVLLLEAYEPMKVDGYIYRDMSPDGKLVSATKKEYKTIEEFQASLSEDDLVVLGTGLGVIYEAKLKRVKVTQVCKDHKVLSESMLELDTVPIIEFRGEDTFNGEPRGEVDYLAENQQFMSKALNMVISNAAMGSLLRFIIDDQAVLNMTHDELKDALTTHGGIIWMHRDPVTGKFPVETLRPEPLNDTFTFLVNYMAMTMEYGLQQHGITMGDASQAPRTLGATLQIGEWAEEAMVLPRVEIERGIQRLYNLFFQWAPQVYDHFKVFSTYDDGTDEEQSYAINVPALNADTLFSDKPITILSNMSNFRARWRIRTGSMAPSRSVEKANLFKDLLQVTQNPAFLKPLLEHLPLSKHKAELAQAVDLVPQLQQQLAQMQQQNQQLEGEVDRQIQQNIEAQKRNKINEGIKDFDIAVNKKINDLENKGKDLDRAIQNVKSAGSRSGTNNNQ